MPNTYTNLTYHIVFSTKKRRQFLSSSINTRLFPYIIGIAKNNDFKIISINGIEDHIHILLSIKPHQTLSKTIQLIKGNSSKWIHGTFPELQIFKWQEGYGAFTVSTSHISIIKNYIANQQYHHQKINFQDEYRAFIQKHNIDIDERYLF